MTALQQAPRGLQDTLSADKVACDTSNKGSKLIVEAIWHEQVHQSRISYLAASEDGDTLLSGCDASAPKPVESLDLPAAVVSSKDGKLQHGFGSDQLCNVRLILARRLPMGQLHCITDQGSRVILAPIDDPLDRAGLKAAGTACKAAAVELQEDKEGQDASSSDATQSKTAGGPEGELGGKRGPRGPEFVAETGYRGLREGYLYRCGTKGLGYYRKDVVRIFAPRQPPPAATAGTPAPDTPTSACIRQPPPATGNPSGPPNPDYLQRLLRTVPSMQSAVTSKEGSLLFTSSLGCKDHYIRVWRLPVAEQQHQEKAEHALPALTPTLLHTLCGHNAQVLSLALNPEETLLFSGSHDYSIRVWSTADWRCLRVLKGHGGGVRALAVSPDGGTLYSAAGDNTLRAWSTKFWVCLRTLHGRHEETTWPCCMVLSPDGELLASGSNGLFGGSTIKVFQARSHKGREAGTCLATFAQLGYHQKGAVSALTFSPDGRTLYSGASDGTLAAWRLSWVDPPPAGRGPGLRKGFY